MGWDSSRPVPWLQLTRSWLIYVAIMAVVFVLFFRDQPLVGIFAGLLISGPLYLGFGWVLAKFGYQRKTWSELRAERDVDPAAGRSGRSRSSRSEDDEVAGPKPKPPPTSRTGGGSGRPSSGKKRRR
jgi:hypothetical protein